jgi:hypothetical protein
MQHPVLRETGLFENSSQFLRERYPTLYDIAAIKISEELTVNEDYLKAFYCSENVIVDDEFLPRFHNKTNQWKMHYKIEKCFNFANERHEKFDLYMRIRPDQSVKKHALIDYKSIFEKSNMQGKIFSDAEMWLHYGSEVLGMGDRYFIGGYEASKRISQALSFVNRTAKYHKEMYMYGEPLPHSTLAFSAFYNGVLVDRVPNLLLGDFLNHDEIDPTVALQAIQIDIKNRIEDNIDSIIVQELERLIHVVDN